MTGGGRQQWRNQAGRLRGMKATTGKSVFSGLVERWPSLRGTWTTESPQCSRYQSVLQSDLHRSSHPRTQHSGFLCRWRMEVTFCLFHFLHLSFVLKISLFLATTYNHAPSSFPLLEHTAFDEDCTFVVCVHVCVCSHPPAKSKWHQTGLIRSG